jgi:hypothetical protein
MVSTTSVGSGGHWVIAHEVPRQPDSGRQWTVNDAYQAVSILAERPEAVDEPSSHIILARVRLRVNVVAC